MALCCPPGATRYGQSGIVPPIGGRQSAKQREDSSAYRTGAARQSRHDQDTDPASKPSVPLADGPRPGFAGGVESIAGR